MQESESLSLKLANFKAKSMKLEADYNLRKKQWVSIIKKKFKVWSKRINAYLKNSSKQKQNLERFLMKLNKCPNKSKLLNKAVSPKRKSCNLK